MSFILDPLLPEAKVCCLWWRLIHQFEIYLRGEHTVLHGIVRLPSVSALKAKVIEHSIQSPFFDVWEFLSLLPSAEPSLFGRLFFQVPNSFESWP